MKRTLVTLLLAVVLILAYSPVKADTATENDSFNAENQQVEYLGEAGGSAYNMQNTYGTNFQLDLYIESFQMDQTVVWNPQLDASIETIKTININKTTDVDVDVNKDINITETENEGGDGEVVQSVGGSPSAVVESFGYGGGGPDIDVGWFPKPAVEVDIVLENVQVSSMAQTGGQCSAMGVHDAYAEGNGSLEMQGLNQHLVQQSLEASNGAIGVQQIASSSATQLVINGGGAEVTTDSISASHESSGGLGIVD